MSFLSGAPTKKVVEAIALIEIAGLDCVAATLMAGYIQNGPFFPSDLKTKVR